MDNKIDEIVARMKGCLEDFECGDGASDIEICNLEYKFNITFPNDYRYFLKTYGYVDWDGTCVLGICHLEGLQKYFSMDYYTESDRANVLPKHFSKRPENTVVVGPYGGGGHFFLFCQNSNHSGKVALYLTELHGKADKANWSTFSDFLRHYIE